MEMSMQEIWVTEPRGRGRGAAARAFARGLDYGAIVAASEKVAWTVDEVFADRGFDPERPIVPASWIGADALDFLDERDRLVLNHCRAFSYAHLLGNFEEFAPIHLAEMVAWDWHADRAHLRALLRFGDEEMKHQQLFLRTERVLEESCGHSFGRYFDDEKERVSELARAILGYPPLPRFLIVLALELGTQRHYAESVRDRASEREDALYVDVLKAHWLEEAQHVKSDLLEIDRLAGEMSRSELELAFDDLAALGGLVEAAFVGQAAAEVETLERVTGRVLSEPERAVLRRTLSDSLRAIIAGIGLGHPGFARVALELSPRGAARLGIGPSAEGPVG
jgi:hypothetical protein